MEISTMKKGRRKETDPKIYWLFYDKGFSVPWPENPYVLRSFFDRNPNPAVSMVFCWEYCRVDHCQKGQPASLIFTSHVTILSVTRLTRTGTAVQSPDQMHIACQKAFQTA